LACGQIYRCNNIRASSQTTFEAPMIPALRSALLLTLLIFSMILLSACTERTPEEVIELKLESYRTMVLDYGDAMTKLRAGEITTEDAEEKVGRDAMKTIEQAEYCIRELVETHRMEIGEGIADAFLSKVERYSKLVRNENPQGTVPKMVE
jgi:hypothetical protein